MSKKKPHAHRLRRHTYKTGTSVYFCTLPDCYFKVECEAMLGKPALCNLCGDEFVMNEYHLKLKKPHCAKCNKIKVTRSDGTKHYVRRDSFPFQDQARVNQIVQGKPEPETAKAHIADLRERLNSLSRSDADEDI